MGDQFTSESLQQAAEALNAISPPTGFELRHRELVSEVLAVSRMERTVAMGIAEADAESTIGNLAREADSAVELATPGRCAPGLTPPVSRRR